MRVALALVFIFLPALQAQNADEAPQIPLTVPSGAPLRLYLTKRVSKHVGTPVEGKTIESVFAFDREVAPAGSVVSGKVSRVEPVTGWQRFRAIVNGDFTPLRNAQVEFESLTLPDGRKVSLHTVETMGM